MTTDPIEPEKPHGLTARPNLAYGLAGLALIASALAVIFTLYLHSSEQSHQLRQLQDTLCGFFTPIGHAPITAKTSQLGRTIVIAGRHGAQVIHCPPKATP